MADEIVALARLAGGEAVLDLATCDLSLSHFAEVSVALAWPLTRYRIAALEPAEQHRLRQETKAAIRAVGDLRWRSEVHIYAARR